MMIKVHIRLPRKHPAPPGEWPPGDWGPIWINAKEVAVVSPIPENNRHVFEGAQTMITLCHAQQHTICVREPAQEVLERMLIAKSQ